MFYLVERVKVKIKTMFDQILFYHFLAWTIIHTFMLMAGHIVQLSENPILGSYNRKWREKFVTSIVKAYHWMASN